MHHHIIEIKARCHDHQAIRNILLENNAVFKGRDHQVDTYFKVNHGRLKLRQGNIENHLIHYFREDQVGPKKSDVLLFRSDPESNLKDVLNRALGVLVIVDKQREIYFIDNVKIHLDQVEELGSFLEIEAIGLAEDQGILDKLTHQCNHFLEMFNVDQADLVSHSYSDLLIEK